MPSSHLSGNFSSPRAGRLLLTLEGVFLDGAYRNAGFPSSGSANILIRGYIGPVGGRSYCQPIDRFAPVSLVEVDYPGGGVVWPVGTETVDVSFPSGIYSFGMTSLKITLRLTKR